MRTPRSKSVATRRRSQAQPHRWQATLGTKGRVTLPKPIRDRLLLSPGDRIDFIVQNDGDLRILAPTAPVTALKGALPKPGAPVTLREMDKGVIAAVARRSGPS